MRVACFCGELFESDDPLAHCPECAEPAALPTVTARDAQDMEFELALILATGVRERPAGVD